MASINKRTVRWTTRSGDPRTAERYEALYRDRAGNRHRKLFALKRDAQNWLDAQTAGMVTGQWADPRAGKERFKAYAERWRKRQVHSLNTADAYERTLRVHAYPVLGGMRLDAITPRDIQVLVKQWSQTAAATTVETRYTMLATVFRGAVKERVIPASPCVDIKLPRLDAKASLVPISTEVVLALRDALPPRYRAFVVIGAGTGMRRGELLGLTLDRVSEGFGTIRVDRQLARRSTTKEVVFAATKTNASVRTIGVAQVVLDSVANHVAEFGVHESGLLFTSEVGSPVGTSVLQRAWSIAAAKVGTDATPHDLRHYFASVQIAGGCSIKKLQSLLGHKSATETWDTYGHLMGDEDDRSRAVIQQALGTLVGGLANGRESGREQAAGANDLEKASTVRPQ